MATSNKLGEVKKYQKDCMYFSTTGLKCVRGERCRYLHEMPPISNGYERLDTFAQKLPVENSASMEYKQTPELCKLLSKKGYCPRANCHFLHYKQNRNIMISQTNGLKKLARTGGIGALLEKELMGVKKGMALLEIRLSSFFEENWKQRMLDQKVPELQSLAREKGLSPYGRKNTLIKRLILHNHIQFHLFLKLPPELQFKIWEFSLPDARILCLDPGYTTMRHSNYHAIKADRSDWVLSDIARHSKKLMFPAKFHTPNPAALSVCRTSRHIALQRYKLCFGTSNVYADLPGGDVLYIRTPFSKGYPMTPFGPHSASHLSRLDADEDERVDIWAWLDNKPLHPSIVADLEQVTHLVIGMSRTALRLHWSNGEPFSHFKRLRKVSIVAEPTELCAGQIVLDTQPAASNISTLYRNVGKAHILKDKIMRDYEDDSALPRELYYGSQDPKTYWMD